MQYLCAWCEGELPKENFADNEVNENKNEKNYGICDDCLEIYFSQEAPKVKAYSLCTNCKDRVFKCHVVACDKLSAILSKIDEELKRRGL